MTTIQHVRRQGCAGAALAALLPWGCTTVGTPAARWDPLKAWLQDLVDRREIPGAVVLVARHGQVACFEAFGYRDREAAAPMTRDTIFRIASMTKPVTTVAALMLVEEGRLALADPVARHLPAFADPKVGVETVEGGTPTLKLVAADRPPTLRDLLRHTSGLIYGFIGRSLVKDRYQAANLYDPTLTLAEVADRLATLPLQHQPGTTWEYGMSTDLLGRVVEVASGMALDRFLAERVFAPLGMKDTAFRLADPGRLQRLAQPQVLPATGRRPALPDPARPTWPSGGGGLVSTAADYGRFCRMLLDGGVLDGQRLLAPSSVRQMMSDQLPPGTQVRGSPFPILDVRPGHGQSYGFGVAVRVADGLSPFPGTVGDVSWTGGFGTQFWVDPAKSLHAILMIQSAPLSPAHPAPAQRWQRMRELVYAALAGAA